MTDKELQPKAKEEAPAKGERVRPGRVFVPAVDIFETPETLVLVADMPGVSGDKVTLDLKENHLTIYGAVGPPLGAGGGHGGTRNTTSGTSSGTSTWGASSIRARSRPP